MASQEPSTLIPVSLDWETQQRLAPYFPDLDLGAIRIHLNRLPWYARFATIKPRALAPDRRHIYFRSERDYAPRTIGGLALLAHELTHCRQHPMKIRYLWESLKILCRRGGDPYRDNPFEVEAFENEARVRADLIQARDQAEEQIGGKR